MKKLDAKHGAIQSRGSENAIVEKIKTDVAWPAFASGGNVNVQRVQETDGKGGVDKRRAARRCGRCTRR